MTEAHPLRCEMWAVINPDGTFMDGTVSMKKKDTIYKGFVWGRCGDDRTQKDFEKEGYRVVKVDVILHTSAKSDAVLDELRTLKQYDHIKFYPGNGCLPNTRQIAKISGFSKDGKRIGIEYQQSCNVGVQMSIPISDVRAVCKWIELRTKER